MSESISKCYLLSYQKYQDFDSIIHLLLENNKIISLIALGTQKVNSKNFFQLKQGVELEVEFFQSRTENKLSKLKKIKIIKDKYLNLRTKIIIDQFNYNIIRLFDKQIDYQRYQHMINMLINNNNQDIINLMLYTFIIELSGTRFYLDGCSICNSNEIVTTSIEDFGYLCENCAKKNNSYYYPMNVNLIFFWLKKEQYYQIIKNCTKQDIKEATLILKAFIKRNLYDIN